ncbi:MAG: lamin tail domain-containing protein [Candidatus Kryptonium sp.]|nr:lamin tail domain-containing protein [Candidatus Kryptonium sp.]
MKKIVLLFLVFLALPYKSSSQGYLRNDSVATHTSGITINEVSARSAIVDFNADGSTSTTTDRDEYIEIVNSSSEPIDISGWILGDNNYNYTIPSGTVLGPGNALVVFTNNADVSNFDPGPGNIVLSVPTTSFALANTNDAVGLKNSYGLYIEVYWGTGTLNSTFTSGATLVGSRVRLESWNEGQSQTRNPDYTGSWIQHPTISGVVNWSRNNPTRTLTNPKGSPGRYNYADIPLLVDFKFLNEVPNSFALYQNYPNPFNPITTIEFDIAKEADVKFEIFNLSGEKVVELINKRLSAGRYSVVVNLGDMPSGVYFYRLKAGEFIGVKKMILVK